MNIHNITKIFRLDTERISKNFIALVVLIGISILPSLYAWVNIKACWDVYDNTKYIPVAVVNNDQPVSLRGNTVCVGNQIVEQLKKNDKIKWIFTTQSDADLGILDSTYYAMIEIPSDFSEKLLTLLTENPEKPEIIYKVDTKANPVASKITSTANSSLIQQVTNEFVETVNETVYTTINDVGTTADENKQSILKMKDAIVGLDRNMGTITEALQTIDSNSSNMSGLLKSLSSSMPYVQSSLAAVGKTNSDNQKILASMQNTMDRSTQNVSMDLDYMQASSKKINALFATLNDATETAANTKLNTTIPLINAQLTQMNSAIDATVDYLEQCRDYDVGSDIGTAIADLQKLKTALTELRTAIVAVQKDVATLRTDVDAAYAQLKKDAPALKKAIADVETNLTDTIGIVKTLSDANPSNQQLKDLVTALEAIQNANLGSTLSSLLDEVIAAQPDIDNALTSLSSALAQALTQTDKAISTVDDTIAILQKIQAQDVAARKAELTSMIDDLKAIKPYIADEQNQLEAIRGQLVKANSVSKSIADLVNNDANKIASQLTSAAKTYDAAVRDDIKTISRNLSASMKNADVLIKDAQELASQIENMVSTAQEGTDLSAEFSGDLLAKLNQFSDVISYLGGRLETIDNEDISKIIETMENDPKLVGQYISDPFEISEETIYPIPNYGTGMAPIYTTLAIWVGCLVLNAILKPEVAWFEGVERLTLREKHFGKMLLFNLFAAVQGLVVALGDIFLLKIYVVSPGLFVFFCVYSAVVFSIITYTLLSTLGNVGKAFGIIYLIVQVAGSGGSYPIQVDPKIFQVLQPLFPFTYSLSGMREAIAGPLAGAVTGDIVGLFIFGLLFWFGGYFTVVPLYRTYHQFELGFKHSGLGE